MTREIRGVPKLSGADVELSNFVLGLNSAAGDTCYEASRALLAEIEGLPRTSKRHAASCNCESCRRRRAPTGTALASSWATDSAVRYDPQDWGRKFLSGNGGCVYIDLNHLELCIPEVRSALDHTAAWHAMLRLARNAQRKAAKKLPEGQRLMVIANNSDGLGHSYGGHLSFLVHRDCWTNLFRRKLHHLLFLASFQVSSIVLTGAGKVGSENHRADVGFQLSQRADFFETLTGSQTTYNRPLVNSRDEALCGSYADAGPEAGSLARLHVIFYDTNLCHVACFLKVGMLQIVLAMIEAEEVDAALVLDDPLTAVGAWSHDPGLSATASMADGRRLTAVELQRSFLERARLFAAQGRLEGVVPDYERILDVWDETLGMLERRDRAALARRLDWALKQSLLERVLDERPDLSWASPEIRHLDQLYGSLDADDGLYGSLERADALERLVSEERIAHLTAHPPEDTRAWGRAMLLRQAGVHRTDDVDWDTLRFRFGRKNRGPCYRKLVLADPLDYTRAALEPLFGRTDSLRRLLDELGAREDTFATSGSGFARSGYGVTH